MAKRFNFLGLLAVLFSVPAAPAQTPDLARILERLERLEQENRELAAQVKALEKRLDGTPAAIEQRLNIEERRTEELAQTKVEASQRFPIRITGMALFNAFLNSRQGGDNDYPSFAGPTGARRAGATVRQTVIGLEFDGPVAIGGGRVHGSAYMDFFIGNNNPAFRVRTASIGIDWKTRGILAGYEKPIFNPREPDSLAKVGVSPMTGAGNLWLWLPQARVYQSVALTPGTNFKATVGLLQTREQAPTPDFTGRLESARPALQGRFELSHRFFGGERRIEIAPGFHKSTTHAVGLSIPSGLASFDWFFNPLSRIELSGALYSGRNVGPLGNGYQQGFRLHNNKAYAVRSAGGWGQVKVHLAPRIDFNFFTGRQDDDDRDLTAGRISKNTQYGGNVFFRLAPNLLLGLEASQFRTEYLLQPLRLNNHYDLALAYYF